MNLKKKKKIIEILNATLWEQQFYIIYKKKILIIKVF